MGCPGTGRELDDPWRFKNNLVKLIRSMLPQRSDIILLSHTGSRSYGWSDINYDYDVHGIYLAGRNWWDTLHAQPTVEYEELSEEYKKRHITRAGIDLNMWSLWHLINIDLVYHHGEMIINLSNPFHTDGKIEWSKILKCVSKEFFKPENILHQIDYFRRDLHPRSALHSYRMILIPLYFKEKGVIKHNIFDIEDELGLGLKYHCRCRDTYIGKANMDMQEREETLKEIEKLFEHYREEWSRWDRVYDSKCVEGLRKELGEIYREVEL